MPSAGIPLRPSFVRSIHARIARPRPFMRVQQRRSERKDANETSPSSTSASGRGRCALPAVSRLASAQAYPSRPVRVIVPYAPGGPTDIFARLIAQKLSEHFGKQFYVENIGGAGGNVGMGQGAKAAPDGYTLLVAGTPIVINPTLYERVPFDPYKDFDPVTLAVTSPDMLSVTPSLPVQSVKDLVALIKAQPGKYNFASPGTGTAAHLVGELFRLSLGLDLVHIPFNSAGLAIGSTIAGHTPIAFTASPPVVPQ